MKHFKLTKTQIRMSRVKKLVFDLRLLRAMEWHDELKINAIMKRLDSAYSFLSSRHHKRANVKLNMALTLMKGL